MILSKTGTTNENYTLIHCILMNRNFFHSGSKFLYENRDGSSGVQLSRFATSHFRNKVLLLETYCMSMMEYIYRLKHFNYRSAISSRLKITTTTMVPYSSQRAYYRSKCPTPYFSQGIFYLHLQHKNNKKSVCPKHFYFLLLA